MVTDELNTPDWQHWLLFGEMMDSDALSDNFFSCTTRMVAGSFVESVCYCHRNEEGTYLPRAKQVTQSTCRTQNSILNLRIRSSPSFLSH
jgi:hypothetical protein